MEEAMLILLKLLGGILWFAAATFLFWKLDPKDGERPRWISMAGMQSVIVFVVLGGWALGAALVIHAVMDLVAG
jgi:hypothetical protein